MKLYHILAKLVNARSNTLDIPLLDSNGRIKSNIPSNKIFHCRDALTRLLSSICKIRGK